MKYMRMAKSCELTSCATQIYDHPPRVIYLNSSKKSFCSEWLCISKKITQSWSFLRGSLQVSQMKISMGRRQSRRKIDFQLSRKLVHYKRQAPEKSIFLVIPWEVLWYFRWAIRFQFLLALYKMTDSFKSVLLATPFPLTVHPVCILLDIYLDWRCNCRRNGGNGHGPWSCLHLVT